MTGDWEGAKWVQVLSFSEIRAGTTYLMRRCRICARDHVMLVTSISKEKRHFHRDEPKELCARELWTTSGRWCDGSTEECFGASVLEKRLFRLAEHSKDEEWTKSVLLEELDARIRQGVRQGAKSSRP